VHAADAQDSHELPQGSDELRDLAIQHRGLDTRLHKLSSKPYRSASEELEEHALRKRKLALKDQMEQVTRGLEHQS
jgi:uncharacterized protein YdcH (DUF465 family)